MGRRTLWGGKVARLRGRRHVTSVTSVTDGAEANASCNCGKPYVPKKQRVAEYDKEHPGRSTRQAAADLGVSKSTVSDARQGVQDRTPEIEGRDGKVRRLDCFQSGNGFSKHLNFGMDGSGRSRLFRVPYIVYLPVARLSALLSTGGSGRVYVPG